LAFAENKREVIGGIIGALFGFLCIPSLTFLAFPIPNPILANMVFLLAWAPYGYLALVCVGGAIIAVIGTVIGRGIAELSQGG